MATKVTVTASGSAKVYCEESGGAEASFSASAKTFATGASGGTVSMLTVKREAPGPIAIQAVDGNVTVELDGNYKSPKKLGKGKTLKLASRNQRALVKEPA